jgi:hypothetical protein
MLALTMTIIFTVNISIINILILLKIFGIVSFPPLFLKKKGDLGKTQNKCNNNEHP